MAIIAKIVKPYWKLNHGFRNAMDMYREFIVLPTVGIFPWKKEVRVLFRYPDGAYEYTVQVIFMWLAWEYHIILSKRNYTYTSSLEA